MSKKAAQKSKTFRIADWLNEPFNQGLFLALFAFLIYANAIPNGYALDDEIVINKNKYTQEGLSGLGGIFSSDPIDVYFNKDKNLVQGGRYRPLSIATFALEVELFGENPQISHFVNALLFALTVLVLFQLLHGLAPPDKQRPWYTASAFLITLLFAAHPIHTEAIANIKGRDEVMALLFGLLAFRLCMNYFDQGKFQQLLLGLICFFLALLSKESVLPLLAVIPLAPWFFREKKIQPNLIMAGGILATTAIYLILRFQMVGLSVGGEVDEILNNPFAEASTGERFATISHTLGLYLWKMLLPYPLSHDYYPWQIPISNWGDMNAIIPLLVYLALAAGLVWGLLKKRKFAFGLLFYFATLSIVSNIFFSIGTTMGERFVFIPSLGFIMFLVWGLEEGMVAQKRLGAKPFSYILIGAAGIFAILTLLRNPVWQDNYTLFTTDVETSPNSAKLRTSAGGALIEYGDSLRPGPEQSRSYRDALGHLQASLEIYPEHGQTWLLLGNAHYKLKNPKAAIEAYETAIQYRPNFQDAYQNAAAVAGESEMYPEAARWFRELCRFMPQDAEVWFSRGVNFEKSFQADSALFAYQRALKLNPGKWEALGNMALVYGRLKNDLPNAIAYGESALQAHQNAEWLYENLGIAYGMSGQPAKAIEVFNRGLKQFPNSGKLHLNVGVTYQNMGDTTTANQFFNRAVQLNPALRAQ